MMGQLRWKRIDGATKTSSGNPIFRAYARVNHSQPTLETIDEAK